MSNLRIHKLSGAGAASGSTNKLRLYELIGKNTNNALSATMTGPSGVLEPFQTYTLTVSVTGGSPSSIVVTNDESVITMGGSGTTWTFDAPAVLADSPTTYRFTATVQPGSVLANYSVQVYPCEEWYLDAGGVFQPSFYQQL